jgi:hypothetical protein
MSRLNQQNSLNYGNKETHIFTEFGTLAKESTQKEVLEAIKNININIEGGTFEASDTITHQKLDTLNTTVTNKHLTITNDSVSVGCDIIEVGAVSDIYNKKALVNASNVYAYNSGSGSVETITFSNSSYVETEETKNRLDTTAILVDSVNNENKIRIKPANSTMDSTYNGVVTDSILFGTKSNGDIMPIAITNDKEIKVSANISNTSIEVTGSIDANITNDVIIVDPINNSINECPYDLLINGPTLWADSTPLVNPFFADPNGREGWYYDNFSNAANVSNIYWYANPVSGNLQENDMTFAQLSGMYCIITPDYVENGGLTNPIMAIYSQPTGTNDFIPTFAHSRWSYSLSNINLVKLRKAETIILYTGATRPEVHLNIPAYQLNLASTNGDALNSEIIAYMTVNTQATTSKIGYLLQYTGFLNSAIGFNREFQFKNSKERVIQNNQYSGSISISNTSLAVTGAFYPETQPISGSISVSNFPSTQPISGSISVSNFPATQAVTGAFYPETQPISGSISVSNFPSTQPVSGSISISNFPTTQAVTGAFYPETQSISGSISVSNFPSTQSVSGSVSISNFPTTQAVTGDFATENTLSNIDNTLINLQFTTPNKNLKVEIMNDNAIDVNTNLDLSILATETTLGSIKQKTDDLSFSLIDTEQYLNVNVGNELIISAMPNLSASTDSIELYAQDPTTSLKSIQCDSTGHLDIVGSVTVNTITDYNLETTQVDIKNQTNKLQFTSAPDSYLKVAVQNFPSGDSTVSIKDSNGDNLLAVSASVPQLRSTLYDVNGNNISSSETSVGSGIYALKTFNNELNNSYNPTAFSIHTAPKLYNGSTYVEQIGDANGRAEININSSGTAITHTGTALDVEIKNTANINVDVQNTSLDTHIMGNDGTGVYNDVFVDANGFLTSNIIEAVHQNIDVGFDENVDKLTKYKGSSGYMTWKAQNAYSKQQNGWYVSGDAANIAALTWYNNGDFVAGGGNPTIPFNPQYNFTKADIDIWYMIIQNYNCNSLLATFPFILVMSKPTGSGDYAPYAHSIWVYSINANQFINNGSSIMIYNGNLARVKTNDIEAPRVSYSLMNTLGAGGNNEVIGHITMETQPYPSSGITIDLNVIEGAVYVKHKSLINYYFDNNRQNVLSGSNILTDKSSNSTTTNKIENSSYNAVGLDTRATLYASPIGTSGQQQISFTATSSPNVSYSLDTYIQNSSTTNNAKDYIIGGLDVNNRIGLNTYQIFPKKLYYNMGGYSVYNVGSALMAGWGNNLSFSNLSTSNSTFYWNLDSTTAGNWGIIYDYINSSGNLVENATQTVATVNGTGTYVPIAGGVQMKGVIRWRFDTFRNVSYALYITPSNSSSAPLGITFSVGGGNAGGQSSNLNGIMIVPNGYVAYIPQLSYVGGANMNICLAKFTDTTGTGGTSSSRQILNKYYYVNLTSKEIMAGNGGGGIGGVFKAGDRFCLMTLDASATARWSNIDVVLEAI